MVSPGLPFLLRGALLYRWNFLDTEVQREKKLCPSLYSNMKAALGEGRGAAWVVADMDEHVAASAWKAPFPMSGSGSVGEILHRSYVGCWVPLRTQAFKGSVRETGRYTENSLR